MSFRPHQPINHDLAPIAPEDLTDGIWAKVYTDCGIVRHVEVVTVSECKRYAVIVYRTRGPRHHVKADELFWWNGKKPHRP